MDKVYQVFISSTYSDLESERKSVSDTLAKAGYIPSGMELFAATDQQQLDFIKRVIDRCDYYVIIIGGRYGSLADGELSFTEREYEYAVSKKIPVLAFLHGEPEKIEVGKTDQDQNKLEKLLAFRERLSKERIIDHWTNSQELCTKIVIAVAQAVNLNPGIGWIRGDQAVDAKILQDLERLRIENSELKTQLNEFEYEVKFPTNVPSPEADLSFIIYAKPYHPEHAANLRIDVQTTWKDFFWKTYESILREDTEFNIFNRYAAYYVMDSGSDIDPDVHGFWTPGHSIRQIALRLEALGLIKVGSTQNDDQRPILKWVITEKGRRYAIELNASHPDSMS